MVQRFDVGVRMSEMAVHNGVCYLAGQIAASGQGDIGAQTREVLAAIDAEAASGTAIPRAASSSTSSRSRSMLTATSSSSKPAADRSGSARQASSAANRAARSPSASSKSTTAWPT